MAARRSPAALSREPALRRRRDTRHRDAARTAHVGFACLWGNILERSCRSAWDPETLAEVPYNYERLMAFCRVLTRKRQGRAN